MATSSPQGSGIMAKLTSPGANTILLVIVLAVAVVALVYSVKNNETLDDLDKKKEKMGNRPRVVNALKEGACGGSCSGSGAVNGVRDGNDFINASSRAYDYPNAAAPVCDVPQVEPHHPYSESGTGGQVALRYSGNYPDETDEHSLDARKKDGCSRDPMQQGNPNGSASTGENCDYSLNSDSLMPGSWREGAQCPDGSDPNSQWAKYAPAKEQYNRYIMASSAARLGVNTRTGLTRITGPNPLLLRSSVAVPISNNHVLFNDSGFRLDAAAQGNGGNYVPLTHC